jgi:glycolate oxidase FAD binding subunit
MADTLAQAASEHRTLTVTGHNSKKLMAGPIRAAQVQISTTRLNRLVQYEPGDLTISVEAGLPFGQLQRFLEERNQMIALDPPFWSEATIGGILATNSSGSMRRGYGSTRDLVIGMTFATIQGKLIRSGGMVVKNVAGLDLGKLLLGSFGTLAVITNVNLRVHSRPPETETHVFSCSDATRVIERRDLVLKSALQPIAIDIFSPASSMRLGRRGYVLAVRAGGTRALLGRYRRDLEGSDTLVGDEEHLFWHQVREFTPDFLARQPAGVIARVSTSLTAIEQLLRTVSDPCIARAGSGVSYVYLSGWHGLMPLWTAAAEQDWSLAVEFAPDTVRESKELWLGKRKVHSDSTFETMEKLKALFDPEKLLNRGRLYGRI